MTSILDGFTRQDVTYKVWLKSCETVIGRIAGVDLDACGDTMTRDAYDNDVSVFEHVHDALEQADFPFDEDEG